MTGLLVPPAKPFTPKSLAARWECSEQHIRDLITGGDVRAFRLGSLLRISAAEVWRIEGGGEIDPEELPEVNTVSPRIVTRQADNRKAAEPALKTRPWHPRRT
jgi:hypothetical protein